MKGEEMRDVTCGPSPREWLVPAVPHPSPLIPKTDPSVKGRTMAESLQEFCDWRGVSMRVDRQAGVIRGVKVLGLESRNGRTYLPEALAQAAPLYEDAKVNVNHPRGNPSGPRDYQDRIGTIRRVVLRPDEGLFADFHFNPKHALAEQLAWDAENMPENVGFSHNVEAKTSRRADRVVVEAITRVQSVDLVADPATTRGLFESDSPEGAGPIFADATIGTVPENAKGDRPIFADTKVGTVPTSEVREETAEIRSASAGSGKTSRAGGGRAEKRSGAAAAPRV